MPWRETGDFYRVWISEIMLQQTRTEAVLPFYERFLGRFPDVQSLAAADEPAVLAAWSGLGYYSRARNLHRAAGKIAAEGFPLSFESIAELPGVGPYTAAALASIALGLPYAAVDGNVIRVISRIDNDSSVISASAARKRFAGRAAALLDRGRPGDFNQAMMELGARVCTPRNPDCGGCPLGPCCAAFAAGTQPVLPVRPVKPAVRELDLDLVILLDGDAVWLTQRSSREKRLAGFWELPEKRAFPHIAAERVAEFSHRIVNDRFRVVVWRARTKIRKTLTTSAGKWFTLADITEIPLATVTRKALAGTKKQRG